MLLCHLLHHTEMKFPASQLNLTSTLRPSFHASYKVYRRPVSEMKGVRRIEEPVCIYDIDRRGDMGIFKYGELNAKVPSYHKNTEGRHGSEKLERIDFRSLNLQTVVKVPRPEQGSLSPECDVIHFDSEDDGEDEIVVEEGTLFTEPLMKRKAELNKSLSSKASVDLWLDLVDIEEQIWHSERKGKPNKRTLVEKQLSILERAITGTGVQDHGKLVSRKSELLADICIYEVVHDFWSRQLASMNYNSDVWKAYLRWLRHGTGVGKFSINAVLEAYQECFTSIGADDAWVIFSDFCLFLKGVDYTERLVILLRLYFSRTFLGQELSVSDCTMNLKNEEFGFKYNPDSLHLLNWLSMERRSQEVYWYPRNGQESEDPDEPLEDYFREVSEDDVLPFLPHPPMTRIEDFLELLCKCLDIRYYEYQLFKFEQGSRVPVVFPRTKTGVTKGISASKTEYLVDYFRDTESVSVQWAQHKILGTPYEFPKDTLLVGPNWKAIVLDYALRNLKASTTQLLIVSCFLEEPVKDLTSLNLLRTKNTIYASKGLESDGECLVLLFAYYLHGFEEALEVWRSRLRPKGTGPLLIALFLGEHKVENNVPPGYRELVYEALNSDVSMALVRLAWHLDVRIQFHSKFRQWLDSLEPRCINLAEVWTTVLELERSRPGSNGVKLRALHEKAVSLVSNCSAIWISYLRMQFSDPGAFKAVLYRAIAECPGCKELYLAGIEAGLKSSAISESDALELVNLMEEKGIRIRRLIEECSSN